MSTDLYDPTLEVDRPADPDQTPDPSVTADRRTGLRLQSLALDVAAGVITTGECHVLDVPPEHVAELRRLGGDAIKHLGIRYRSGVALGTVIFWSEQRLTEIENALGRRPPVPSVCW